MGNIVRNALCTKEFYLMQDSMPEGKSVIHKKGCLVPLTLQGRILSGLSSLGSEHECAVLERHSESVYTYQG